MLLLFLTGVLFWIVYGWKTHSVPVILANIVTLLLNIGILIMKIIFEKTQEVN